MKILRSCPIVYSKTAISPAREELKELQRLGAWTETSLYEFTPDPLGTPCGLEVRHFSRERNPGAPGKSLLIDLSHLGEPGENPSRLILPENYRLITEFRSRTTRTDKSGLSTEALLVAADSSPARTLFLAYRADLLVYEPHSQEYRWKTRSRQLPPAVVHGCRQSYRSRQWPAHARMQQGSAHLWLHDKL